jgi:hypothetical protein
MTDRIVLDVDRDGWTKGLQLNIAQLDQDGCGTGYRIAGPKYNGSSENLLRCEVDERDAREIRKYLDAAFPTPEASEIRAQLLRELAAEARLKDGHITWQDLHRMASEAAS